MRDALKINVWLMYIAAIRSDCFSLSFRAPSQIGNRVEGNRSVGYKMVSQSVEAPIIWIISVLCIDYAILLEPPDKIPHYH
jgi:hypothetical protein